MSARIVIPLSEFASASASAIGERGVELGQFDTLAVPLPATVAIPHQTLIQIITENRLFEDLINDLKSVQLHEPSHRQRSIEKIRHAIKTQPLPEWFTQPILTTYHTTFQRGFIRLLTGSKQTTLDPTLYEHIQGDANLFESLLNFWSEWAEHSLELNPKLHLSTLAPGSILIQEQFQANISGVAFTEHPSSTMKSQVFIQAIRGCPDQELLENQADHYAVDIRTWNVVLRDIAAQTRLMQRSSDDIESIPIPYAEQLSPTLTDPECARLAQLVNQFKLHQMNHYKLSWEMTDEGFYFTDFERLEETSTLPSDYQSNTKTVTKIYISAGNPHKAQVLASGKHDGIGVLRSEYTYAQFGIHPAHIVHSRQREVLEKQLAHTLESYRAAAHNQRVIFRAQNFNSHESLLLDYANPHEPQENNPFLGYRGALKMISNPELIRLELSALRQALKHHGGPIGYMIPFVRSPQELSIIVHHVEAAGLFDFPEFELWWQLNTPENILNFKAYPNQRLTGVSLNITTLQALLHGLDPDNPEIFERYQLNTEALEHMMEHLKQYRDDVRSVRTATANILLHLHIEDFSRELVTTAVKLGYDGIVVKPRSLEIARVCVLEQEEAVIRKKRL